MDRGRRNEICRRVWRKLAWLGLDIDEAANRTGGRVRVGVPYAAHGSGGFAALGSMLLDMSVLTKSKGQVDLG